MQTTTKNSQKCKKRVQPVFPQKKLSNLFVDKNSNEYFFMIKFLWGESMSVVATCLCIKSILKRIPDCDMNFWKCEAFH